MMTNATMVEDQLAKGAKNNKLTKIADDKDL